MAKKRTTVKAGSHRTAKKSARPEPKPTRKKCSKCGHTEFMYGNTSDAVQALGENADLCITGNGVHERR